LEIIFDDPAFEIAMKMAYWLDELLSDWAAKNVPSQQAAWPASRLERSTSDYFVIFRSKLTLSPNLDSSYSARRKSYLQREGSRQVMGQSMDPGHGMVPCRQGAVHPS
jgi:hypothetical protein